MTVDNTTRFWFPGHLYKNSGDYGTYFFICVKHKDKSLGLYGMDDGFQAPSMNHEEYEDVTRQFQLSRRDS